MKIKQIRNATIRIGYAGKIFLIDPWLAAKGKMGSFVDIPGMPFRVPDPMKEQIPMPICDLPESVENILEGIDCNLITHIHPDHVDMNPDGTVGTLLNKKIPTFVQNENDLKVFEKSGFEQLKVLTEDTITFGEVKLTKTPALHGLIEPCGEACGVIFQAEGEKTLYLAGDTIWYSGVKETLQKFKPEVIILNACAAELVENGRLIMNGEDVAAVAKVAPNAKLIISHMNNVAHASITRHSMRGLLAKRGVKGYYMPEDGEIINF